MYRAGSYPAPDQFETDACDQNINRMKTFYEVVYDEHRPVVYVHCSDGSTVARYDHRFGIDLHTSVTEQLNGESQCKLCTHHKPTMEDWNMFVQKCMEFYGVVIDPAFIQELDRSGSNPVVV